MRRLLPTYADTVDLDAAYAYPGYRPWLRANMISSADGAATLDGRSGGLSGAADREIFALLRAMADVVLVGAGTVRSEHYGLAEPAPAHAEQRAARGVPPAPVIAVVSQRLDLDPAAPLFAKAEPPTIVVTSAAAPADRIAALGEVADLLVVGDHRVDLAHTVDALVNRGLTRILCEGGPTLLGHVAAAERLDELCLTVSPQILGGNAGRILDSDLLLPRQSLQLNQVLEDDGFLFLRYGRPAHSRARELGASD
jgi:riboflavin-specific deaminase-like protein